MKILWRSPLFVSGLLVRLLLVAIAVPQLQVQWFVPFLHFALRNPSFDPWTTFLASGGDRMAFPYGSAMLLAHLPLAALGDGLDALFGQHGVFAGIGFRTTLLCADISALWMLLQIAPQKKNIILAAFWLSPLSLYITYWHGQTDIVPIAIMIAAFLALKRLNAGLSGALFALAVAAKLSMFLTVPFILIYLFRNRRLRSLLRAFATGAAVAALLFLAPWALLSNGYHTIVFGTPEAARIYDLSLAVGERGTAISLVPMVYIFMMYAFWRMNRSNFQLLLAMSGISFMAVVLGTLGAPGWYMWVLPFLVLLLDEGDAGGIAIFSTFVCLVLGLLIVSQPGASIPLFRLNLTPPPNLILPAQFISLWVTLLISVGIILMVRMYREGVQGTDYYRLSRRSLAVGIAGDSGVGKDTFARSLGGLFGSHSTSTIFGDAYHKWDRGAPMWRTLTHLNPRANDLLSFSRDALAVISGHVAYRRPYDHKTGRFAHVVATMPREVILVTGLHALLPANLVEALDVRVYLEASEDLRAYWKLRRDTLNRGQTREAIERLIEARRPDTDAYIRPQAQKADVIFRLSPINPDHLSAGIAENIPVKLNVVLREALYVERLVRALIGICALRIDQDLVSEGQITEITIEGEVEAEDIRLAARALIPHLDELLDVNPKWVGDVNGVMQLILLLHIDQTLHKRTTT